MKKIYIIPDTVTVRLMPTAIIAVSQPNAGIGDGDVPAEEIDVKENKNIWDEEW